LIDVDQINITLSLID